MSTPRSPARIYGHTNTAMHDIKCPLSPTLSASFDTHLFNQLEVNLTKKSPAEWPELEDTTASAVMTSAQPDARTKAPASSASKPLAEPPTKLARPYSGTKDWDVVSP